MNTEYWYSLSSIVWRFEVVGSNLGSPIPFVGKSGLKSNQDLMDGIPPSRKNNKTKNSFVVAAAVVFVIVAKNGLNLNQGGFILVWDWGNSNEGTIQ